VDADGGEVNLVAPPVGQVQMSAEDPF